MSSLNSNSGKLAVLFWSVWLGFTLALATGSEPSLSYQPTAVGALWGGVFLAGWLMGGIGRGKLAVAMAAATAAWLAKVGFCNLTDIGSADGILIVTALVGGGWATAAWDPLAGPRLSPHRHVPTGSVDSAGGLNYSIWDLGCLTTLVACICYACPRLQTPAILVAAVVAALLSGLVCSWIACRWAWHDSWTWTQMGGLVICLGGATLLLCASLPAGLGLTRALQWLLSGPASVVAAQATLVLLLSVLYRWDLRNWHPVAPPKIVW